MIEGTVKKKVSRVFNTTADTQRTLNYVLENKCWFSELQLVLSLLRRICASLDAVLLIFLVSSGRPFQVRMELGRKEL